MKVHELYALHKNLKGEISVQNQGLQLCTNSLTQMIEEYERWSDNNQDQKGAEEQMQYILQECNLNSAGIKQSMKPVRVFKDLMELGKENRSKKQIVRELTRKNRQLKDEFDKCRVKSRQMENFLREIECTFKNDRRSQKANDILLKYQQNRLREEAESKNQVEKVIKAPRNNEIIELKMYMGALKSEIDRNLSMLEAQKKENEQLKKNQDMNTKQIKTFEQVQASLVHVLESGIEDCVKMRRQNRQEKVLIHAQTAHKEKRNIEESIEKLLEQIRIDMLTQEGLEYELSIVKEKLAKGSRGLEIKSFSALKQEISVKKTTILNCRKQLKEKIKTNEYLSKWNKQMRKKLQTLKENHIATKEQYEKEISNLSKAIDKWNRKYKAQLVEEQVYEKNKATSNDNESTNQKRQQRKKVRVIKVQEIDCMRKKVVYHLISSSSWSTAEEFIRHQLLIENQKEIELSVLMQRLSTLPVLQDEPGTEIQKFARYVIEDNDSQSVGTECKVSSSMALLILKNLFATEFNASNILECHQSFKQFIRKHYEVFRQNLWEYSAKATDFSSLILQQVFKKFLRNESQILQYKQYIEYRLWQRQGLMVIYSLVSFERLCGDLLGRQLVRECRNQTTCCEQSDLDHSTL